MSWWNAMPNRRSRLGPLLLALLAPAVAGAAIDPGYAHCLERGYQIDRIDFEESCRFPDGSSCPLEAFNAGTCGKKWMTEDYCVAEGAPVWSGRCCEGLQPYLRPGVAGQRRCQKVPEGDVLAQMRDAVQRGRRGAGTARAGQGGSDGDPQPSVTAPRPAPGAADHPSPAAGAGPARDGCGCAAIPAGPGGPGPLLALAWWIALRPRRGARQLG